MSTHDFKFLTEKPLQTSKELSESKFGHEEIAKTLAKIVQECPTPFTVGLFAKWGSGKSTVANYLKDKLPKEKMPVVIFDVWKHEGDSLRRTFLKETVRQLKDFGEGYFDESFILNEKLEQSVSRSAESKLRFKTETLKQLRPYFVWGGLVLSIAVGISSYFGVLDLIFSVLLPFFGFASGGAFLIWLLNQSVNLFSTETVSYGVDKFEDPHQFEEEFRKILCALKNPRVLIIFDNLDRVMHDKVAEVLSTVKTFLEPQDIADDKKEVVFLVPCDARAIKQHLSSLYNPADKVGMNYAFDPDEFLRKFFNTIVWIPDFIPSELESFVRSRLKETKVNLLDDDYVAWIITKAFRNNPRQIIQFTNILLANYLLVVEREGEGKDFEEGFLKDNIAQLTKYLVLNQLFPDEMEMLREKKVLDISDVNSNDLNGIKSKDAFLDFVEQTKNIPITDLRAFFTLRRSEQEKKFPGFNSFVALLEDRQIEEAKKYFSQLGDFAQQDFVNDFSQAVKTELEGKTNPVSTIGLIHTLFAILEENKLSLTSTLYEEVNNILGGRCKEELHTVPPLIMDDILLKRNPSYRDHIVSQWIKVVEDVVTGVNKYKSNKQFVAEVFKIFTQKPEYLSTAQHTKIKELLANNLAGDIEIAKIVTAPTVAQLKILNGEYVRNFINAIPNGGALDDISARLEITNLFEDSLLKVAGADFIADKYVALLASENTQVRSGAFAEKAKILNPFLKFFKDRKVLMTAVTAPVKDRLSDTLISGFNVLPNFEQRSIFVPILFEMRSVATPTKVMEIESHLSGYISNVTPEKFNESFSELPEEDQTQFFETALYTPGAKRAVDNTTFRDTFFPKLSEPKKKQFLEQMFNADLDQALLFIESLDKKDVKYVWEIFDSVWTKFESASLKHKQRILKFVNKHEAGNSAQIREILTAKIITALTSTDHALQQVGLEATGDANAHIAEPKKRAIAKDTFDWLKKPETTSKYQPHALRAVLSEIDQLNDEEQKEFVHFVFDEILRKSANPVHITEAFSILKEVKPKYEERRQNYDDVRTRIETETDQNIKNVLLAGLTLLAPDRTNQNNKDFWSWVDSQVEL